MCGKNATEMLAADAAGIARAAEILNAGGLVAVPTETVYGLAARADDESAVARIYAAKGRPSFNPLIVHVASLQRAEDLAHWSTAALALAAKHWPGPLTLVMPRQQGTQLAEAVTAGLPTVALRMPAHPVMRAILESVAAPIAAPSANRSGFISPTNAQHVLASLGGRIDAVLDGGPCERGVESTIVAVRADDSLELLRPGPISIDKSASAELRALEAPGQLASHYSPGKPVRLNARSGQADEFLIGFGETAGAFSLSRAGDLSEAAANLYECLHRAASSDYPRIAVAPIPVEGIGVAINDRLSRAATPPDQSSSGS